MHNSTLSVVLLILDYFLQKACLIRNGFLTRNGFLYVQCLVPKITLLNPLWSNWCVNVALHYAYSATYIQYRCLYTIFRLVAIFLTYAAMHNAVTVQLGFHFNKSLTFIFLFERHYNRNSCTAKFLGQKADMYLNFVSTLEFCNVTIFAKVNDQQK